MIDRTYTVLHGFCGSGGGALGFAQAEVVLTTIGIRARFECVGGVDFSRKACLDFERLTGGRTICADVLTITPEQLRALAGERVPDVLFCSAPCKGSSGLISKKHAASPKYAAMNELALAWTRLVLSTWDERPRLLVYENVPRIVTRAAGMLVKLRKMLRAAGYILNESSHDCGELGGLAQHRRRWLLVARHVGRTSSLLYKPPSRRVRGVGEVLGEMPMPGDPLGGAMHRRPRLSWLNEIRLALIPAGGDWRDLAGVLAEGQARREEFRRYHTERWEDPSVTIAGTGSNGPYGIADPRIDWHRGVLGVMPWDVPSCTITTRGAATCGAFSVVDPRLVPQGGNPNLHHSKYSVTDWSDAARTVTGTDRLGSGGQSVSDPRIDALRVPHAYPHGYGVLSWNGAAWTIAGGSQVGQGAYAVSDPRLTCAPRAGAYGVLGWTEPSGTVTGSADVDNSASAVADPRIEVIDLKSTPKVQPVIIAADGTWHRALTTLELAALQGFPWKVNGSPLQLAGKSSSGWRTAVGNAVPPPTARAIAEQMLGTLLHADAGVFSLSSSPIWVAPEGDDAPMELVQ